LTLSNQKNILIYRLGSLGDTVIALPVFHKILEQYPDVENITLLTNKPVASMAAPLEAVLGKGLFFKDTLTYPVGTRNPILLAKLIGEIRKRKIHTVINITALRSPNADRRDKLFFKSAGVKEFIGFENRPEDFKVKIDPETGFFEWETARLARKISVLGSFNYNDDKYWDLKLSQDEINRGKELLSGLKADTPFIAINVGTKMPIKDWGIENWVDLVSGLSDEYREYSLVVIGVEEEKTLAENCLDVWKGNGLNLCGKSSPRVSAAILEKASLFIGHDSGPMHLAACMGTPCVAVFSCINQPRQWFPRGENNRVIMPNTACVSSGKKECSSPSEKCILTITPEEVQNAVAEVINKTVLK